MKDKATSFIPAHTKPEVLWMRYIEDLMHLTYKHPTLMKNLFYAAGGASVLLMASPWTHPALGIAAPLSTASAVGLGLVGSLTSFAHSYLQQHIFGLPVLIMTILIIRMNTATNLQQQK